MIFNMTLEFMVFLATAFSAVGAITSAFVATMQFRATKIQEHRSLESMYLNRLWLILDKMENSSDVEKEHVYREYIEFCCDQIELRELGRITDDTWRFWSRDMREFYGVIISDQEFENALNVFLSDKRRKRLYYEAMINWPADSLFDPFFHPVTKAPIKKTYKQRWFYRWMNGL